jgi:thiazole synthase
LDAAVELVPSLANFEVEEMWCGLRPDTIDHLPIIGATGVDNLVLAAGHFRNGILLAPITSNLIAETILHGCVSGEWTNFGLNTLIPRPLI